VLAEAWKLSGVHVENGCGASWTRWPHKLVAVSRLILCCEFPW